MELLNGLGVQELTKPELTGDWEFQLRQVQRKQKSRDEFMTGIADITRKDRGTRQEVRIRHDPRRLRRIEDPLP